MKADKPQEEVCYSGCLLTITGIGKLLTLGVFFYEPLPKMSTIFPIIQKIVFLF